MNNDAILASISKIHAYRYAKEKQRGVKLGYGEKGTSTALKKFTIPPIQIGMSDFTLEYFGNAYGSTLATGCNLLYQSGIISTGSGDLGVNEIYSVSLAGVSSRAFRWRAQTNDEKFHLVIVRSGSVFTVTINNVLQDTVDMGEVKDIGNFSPVIMNSSDVGFVRVWNYALSADEITTLYNNGDPLGYVVPKAMKFGDNKCIAEYVAPNLTATKKGSQIEPKADTFEFNLETAQYLNIFNVNNNPFYSVYRIDYIVDEWEFDPAPSQFVGFGGKPGVTLKGNIKFNTLEDAKIGEQQTFYAYLTEGTFRGVDLYAGSSQESSTTRRLKVTIKSITPVSAATIWLDSAKQLPWGDAYLPPLLQSKGGYDMVANGAPEVLFKESDTISFPGLIAAWSAKGKTNNDLDRDILKDLTGNGHDITLRGLSYTQDSGYENPEYPDGLVLNGVDNWGICESISELSDITIIGKFVYNNDSTKVVGGFYTTYYNAGKNAWILLQANNELGIRCGETNYQSFTVDKSIKGIPLIVISNRTTSNTTLKSYVNKYIFKTTSSSKLTGSKFTIGSSGNISDEVDVKNRALKGVFYSAYVFNRSLSDDEMQTFVRKYIDPNYVLPTE